MGHDYVRQFRSKHVDVELADPVPMLVYLGPWLYMIGAPSVQRVQYRALLSVSWLYQQNLVLTMTWSKSITQLPSCFEDIPR